MSLRSKGEIYLIKGPEKGYIGQTVCQKPRSKGGADVRFAIHIRMAVQGSKGCPALYSAIRKYGPSSFSVKTIRICERSELNYYETKYIRQYNTLAPNGYNLEKGGGNLLTRHSDTIERLRSASTGSANPNFGKQRTEAVRAKISAANSGKVRTEEMRAAMKLIKLGSKKTEACKAKTRDTNLSRYGFATASQHADVKEKMKATCLERFGFANAMQNKEFAKATGAAMVGFRRKPEYANLPRYIQRVRGPSKDGYQVINHPTLKRKAFASKKKTLEENMARAKAYLAGASV